MIIHIIVGSTRTTETGLKIAENIKNMLNTILNSRRNIKTEIVKIAHYNLPFYTDKIAPADRTEGITDLIFKNWSDKIKQAHGYIIISPVYNYGYPSALKNTLDCLYKE